MQYSQALVFGVEELRDQERPRLESELLLSFVLGVERVYLHTHSENTLSLQEWQDFQNLIQRRKNNEPIEYILQKVSFYGKEWSITQGVLIPRPETELLIDKASEFVEKEGIESVLEFGIGSGVISITLALLHPHLQIIGTDINPLAIALSEENLEIFSQKYDASLKNRVRFCKSDILKDQVLIEKKSFDLLVSNPPYIALDYPLPPNVLYEPKEALFGGVGGEEILYNLIEIARERKIRALACEMGFDQKAKMQQKLKECKSLEFYKDLSGLDRGFVAILQKSLV